MTVLFALMIILTHINNIFMCNDDPDNPTPMDNTHYVEGVSRFFWSHEGDGPPTLEDLWYDIKKHERLKGGSFNQYWLYTKTYSERPYLITYGIWPTISINRFLPLQVVIHGHRGSPTGSFAHTMKNAFLEGGLCNIIVVDWSHEANDTYVISSHRVFGVGLATGRFLNWFVKFGRMSWEKVHIVGYGLGSHIAGTAGRHCTQKPSRVTGLSPTAYGRKYAPTNIKRRDGRYVEVIHTNDKSHTIPDPQGDVDFYANGGGIYLPQPGCPIRDPKCSTKRAYQLFAASVEIKHVLFGKKCVNLEQARSEGCIGSKLKLGGNVVDKSGKGIYGIRTTGVWPYDDKLI